ncbi:hypothetical protein BCR35DRAFT_90735 [Leucosporidium creatinivorum]|uniref:Uncharacterized protein n=1 Tax=Leucosporidium creatinivorum TaxID=106004 RepID=A0A1Y2FBP5_9BASI|nr:hypothetical protein BCR35DRAFT_90735 [Leucosporidium creatinivorum]
MDGRRGELLPPRFSSSSHSPPRLTQGNPRSLGRRLVRLLPPSSPSEPQLTSRRRYLNSPSNAGPIISSISVGGGPLPSNPNANAARIPAPMTRAAGATSAPAPTPTEVLTLAAPPPAVATTSADAVVGRV